MSTFAPHGQYHICVKGRIFHVKCVGAWNQETMIMYAKESYEHSYKLLGPPWAMLTDIREWELATKDSEPLLIRLVASAIKNGLCREAVVNDKGVMKIEQLNIALPEGSEFERRFFDNEASAIEWLEQEGFPYGEQATTYKKSISNAS